MNARLPDRRGAPARRRPIAWMVLGVSLLSACSTLTPQVFHPELLTRDAERGPCAPVVATRAASSVSIGDALQVAHCVRGQYVQAVKDLSEVQAGTAASLIWLPALALFKGITHPNSQDLAGLGIAGSASYAYGTTMTSRPRQMVYLSGAEAMNCVIGASQPYLIDAAWLDNRPAADSGQGDGLLQLVSKLRLQRPALEAARQALEPHTQAKTVTPPPRSAGKCPSRVPLNCAEWPASETLQRRLCDRQEADRRSRCNPAPVNSVTQAPDPKAIRWLDAVNSRLRHIDQLIGQAERLHDEFDSAGARLSVRTVAIQLKVAAEVLKTEPDLEKVLSTARGMRTQAYALSQAPALAAAASAASAPDGSGTDTGTDANSEAAPKVQTVPSDVVRLAQRALDQSAEPYNALHARVGALQQRSRESRRQLAQCAMPGAAQDSGLQVQPPDDEVKLDPARKQVVFKVSSRDNLMVQYSLSGREGAKQGEVTRSLDAQNVFTITYTMPADAKEGDAVLLSLRGDPRAPAHDVLIVVGSSTGKSP